MNQKTEKVIQTAVQKLISIVESTAKFAADQTPDILRELIEEAKIKLTFNIVLSSVALAVAVFVLHKSLPLAEKDRFEYIVATIASAVAICLLPIALFDQAQEALILKRCPKLYLLKRLKQLASKDQE